MFCTGLLYISLTPSVKPVRAGEWRGRGDLRVPERCHPGAGDCAGLFVRTGPPSSAEAWTALAVSQLYQEKLEPAEEVVVVDVPRARVSAHLTVGARPTAAEVHPDGDLAIVLSHMSPYAAVIDLENESVTGKLHVGYYAQSLAFSPPATRNSSS